jgi:hypothetical protein
MANQYVKKQLILQYSKQFEAQIYDKYLTD